MRHGSLFSGIGGFDLASEWMGWENVFHCEWMEFPRKVLEYYWPEADSHIDICKTDFKKYANRIDILTGGFPCQPFSLAGKRKGTDDERYLWGEMLRAIQEIKPTWVIAENVFGITNIDGGLVFEQVCLDLEAEGYEVQPFVIPAAAKNAPHRRDRCWFIAYSESARTGSNIGRLWCEFDRCSEGLQKNGNATYTTGNGLNDKPTTENNCIGQNNKQSRTQWKRTIERFGNEWNATDTESICIQGQRNRQGKREFRGSDWSRFPTQSPICSGDDGLPTELDGITFPKWRNESIKGYGNAIVPQIAYELFKIIEHENKNQSTTAQQQDNISSK
jgi:DNA (cytosine-5)-methyltransferase 1